MPIFDTIECVTFLVKQFSGMESQSPEEHAEEANDILIFIISCKKASILWQKSFLSYFLAAFGVCRLFY